MPAVVRADDARLRRPTREQHVERMGRVEQLLRESGWTAADVARHVARECAITHRQAERYVSAVRSIYAHAAERHPLLTREEWFALVMRDHAIAVQTGDMRAAQKLLETIARANGWYAPRVVKVDATVTHTHTHEAINRLGPDEQAALAAYHEARARRELAGAVEAVASVDSAPTSADGALARPLDGLVRDK